MIEVWKPSVLMYRICSYSFPKGTGAAGLRQGRVDVADAFATLAAFAKKVIERVVAVTDLGKHLLSFSKLSIWLRQVTICGLQTRKGLHMRTRLFSPLWLAVVIMSVFPARASGAEIEFVHGYKGMAKYARAVLSNANADRDALNDEYVYAKYFDSCSGDTDRRAMSKSILSTSSGDAEALLNVIGEIEGSGFFENIEKAVVDSTSLLPIDKLTVCIFALPPDSGMADFVISEFNGVFGFSESPGVLWIQLLPTDGWLDEIFPAFSHEYFHAAAHPDNPMGTNQITLLDMLINEGGADSFTALLYPEFVPSWTSAISLQQEKELWPMLHGRLDSSDFGLIQDVLYGNGNDIPRQSGYTIGYQIVQGYLAAHPDDPPIVWSRVDPSEILAESGYDLRVAEGPK